MKSKLLVGGMKVGLSQLIINSDTILTLNLITDIDLVILL